MKALSNQSLSPKTANLVAFLLLMFAVPLTGFGSQRQQEAGNIIYASPGDNLSTKAKSLSPGDGLILHDGLYTNSQLLVDGIHGTQTAPITIQAEHDGKTIIDGAGSVPHVIEVSNSSYIIIDGLVARNAGPDKDVVNISGESDHITLRRISAYNAGSGNAHVFDVMSGPTNVLIEDSAGWGQGRYIFDAYHSSNVIFRRAWARWTTQANFSPAPRACYGIYGSINVTLENPICIHDIPDQPSNDYFTAVWITTNGPPEDNAKILGAIFLDNWEGIWVNDSSGNNTQVLNSLFENTRKQGNYTTTTNHGDGIMWGTDNGRGGGVDTSTFANNEVGFNNNTNQHPTLTNTVFVYNTTAILGNPTQSSLDFFGNSNIGATVGPADKQVDPGYDVAKYGRGAYLFIPPNSPLKGAGQGGSDIGANIIYRYQDGVLTNQPLWPWPMEDRVETETGLSVTWESEGGLWKTLDGVYPKSNLTPVSPTVSVSSSTPQPSTAPTSSSGNTRQSGWFLIVLIVFILLVFILLISLFLRPRLKKTNMK
jgi:hypothetical protein